MASLPLSPLFFFFNDTATTEIYTLSLHDALPISVVGAGFTTVPQSQGSSSEVRARLFVAAEILADYGAQDNAEHTTDRKSTRLNSSHGYISYAVFCLKKKKQTTTTHPT